MLLRQAFNLSALIFFCNFLFANSHVIAFKMNLKMVIIRFCYWHVRFYDVPYENWNYCSGFYSNSCSCNMVDKFIVIFMFEDMMTHYLCLAFYCSI